MEPTLPSSVDPLAPPIASPLATTIGPPPIVRPASVRRAPAVADGAIAPLPRVRRVRVSLIHRAIDYFRSALRDALHDTRASAGHQPRSWGQRLIGATPPWFVSLLIHASLMLLLGLVAVRVHQQVTEEMSVAVAPDEDVSNEIWAETKGEQLETPAPGVTPDDVKTGTDPTYAISELPEVADPLAAPPKSVDLAGDGSGIFSDVDAPSIGHALEGRQAGRKKQLLDSYGGTMTTQHSVDLALAWLMRQQGKDGLWSLKGPYPDGSDSENKVSATAMALLAFLGDGHTHLQNGPYRQTVQRGVRALLKLQGSEGELVPEGGSAMHRMYTHAQSTIVLCELYGMTDDSELRDAAQHAVKYCVDTQAPGGGWRYFPKQEADVSVTGWFVMALQSARMAKLEVPSETLMRVGKFLDSASSHNGSRYAYQPGRPESPPMTAEALLCRQYLGWNHSDPRLTEGVAYVGRKPVDWNERNVYYWYYATQVMHHMGGEPWVAWNRVMRQVIPENQVHAGKQHGSWDPGEDQWGRNTGRLFVTCLSTYMLEVYYRHLPLYAHSALAESPPAAAQSKE